MDGAVVAVDPLVPPVPDEPPPTVGDGSVVAVVARDVVGVVAAVAGVVAAVAGV